MSIPDPCTSTIHCCPWILQPPTWMSSSCYRPACAPDAGLGQPGERLECSESCQLLRSAAGSPYRLCTCSPAQPSTARMQFLLLAICRALSAETQSNKARGVSGALWKQGLLALDSHVLLRHVHQEVTVQNSPLLPQSPTAHTLGALSCKGRVLHCKCMRCWAGLHRSGNTS